MAGLLGLVAALSLCLAPGLADAKKGKARPGWRHSTSTWARTCRPGQQAQPGAPGGFASKPDSIANAIGFGLEDVNANDFDTRAVHIAALIKNKKVDLVGLQEAALLKLQVPTDGSPLNPAAQRARTVT